MSESAQEIEPRWPVALANIAVLVLLGLLPGQLRIYPFWIPVLLVIAFIVPMAALSVAANKARWLRIERIVTLAFLLIVALSFVPYIAILFSRMLRPSADFSGLQLLNSGLQIWVINVINFSVAYWRIDQGGPESRANGASMKYDWQFPQREAMEGVSPEWRPSFIDYLFLSFCTATAFSPTQDLPMTSRAKILMMIESAISLVTIIAVASRAINILGS